VFTKSVDCLSTEDKVCNRTVDIKLQKVTNANVDVVDGVKQLAKTVLAGTVGQQLTEVKRTGSLREQLRNHTPSYRYQHIQFTPSSSSTTTLPAYPGALVGVVECRICNWEVAGSNLGLGYFALRSTQPSIPPGSVNEYQLRLGSQRQVWLIRIADERVGVWVKL